MGIILIPGLIFASIAQIRVNNAYKQYSKVISKKNILAKDDDMEVVYEIMRNKSNNF